MPRNIHFQDYWLTDPNVKLWVRKSDDKTAFCSYCQKKIDMTNGGESAHARLTPFEGKGENHKLRRTPVAGNGGLLDHLKKPENEGVTSDPPKKRNNSTRYQQSTTQLSITAVAKKKHY